MKDGSNGPRKDERPPLVEKVNNMIPAERGSTVGYDKRVSVALEMILSLANSGAMLGHDHAYDACRRIEAIATEALGMPSQTSSVDTERTL